MSQHFSSSQVRASSRRTSRRKQATAAAASNGPEDAAAASSLQPLSRELLHSSLSHALSKQHPIALSHCLRHACASTAPVAGALLASPGNAVSPRPRPSPSAGRASGASPLPPAAAAVTLPSTHPSLGVRSLLFARAQPLLVVTTAEGVFVWRHPALLLAGEEGDERGAAAADSAALGGWSCIASLHVGALQRASSATHLPCPVQGCSAFEHPPREETADAQSTLRVCFSLDERVLFVAVNEPARAVAASPNPHGTPTGGAASLRSPAPRSSPATRSPAPASSSWTTPAKASPAPAALSGSPNIERDFDALFASMDDDAPVAATPATQTQQQGSPAPSGADTPGKSATQRSRKRKFTGPQASSTKATTVLLPPSYAVFALRLDGAPASTAGVPAPMSAAKGDLPRADGATTDDATSAMEEEDQDILSFSSMLGEMNAQLASPSPATSLMKSPAVLRAAAAEEAHVSRCGHLSALLAAPAPVSALLALGMDSLVLGDSLGAVGLWSRSSEAGAWKLQRTLCTVSGASVVALALLDGGCEEEKAAAVEGKRLLVTFSNADVLLCDVATGRVLSAVSASLHSQPVDGTAQRDAVGMGGSPTLSTPPNSQQERPDALPGAATLHDAAPLFATADAQSISQLLLLVSPPKCDEPVPASSPNVGASQPARKSARKLAAAAPSLPSAPCPGSLPSVVSLRIHWPSGDGDALPGLEARAFPVPFLLSDDNPSVHATAIASSSTSLGAARDKLGRLTLGGGSASPPSLLAFGLSSGELVLHSASSGRLVAMLSDGSDAAAELDASQGAAAASNKNETCDAAVSYPSAFDEQHFTQQRSLAAGNASQSPATLQLSQLSPVPSSSPSQAAVGASQRASQRKASPRRSRASVALSPPPSSMPSPSVAPTQAKHICTQAVTALAFHPRFHALLAVGDQRGHVHLFAPMPMAR